MNLNINSTNCCGLRQLDNLENTKPKEAIRDIWKNQKDNEENPPFYIFTGVTKEEYGQNLEKYIQKNNLGKVTKTRSRRNPNSENYITIWTWEVCKKGLAKWSTKNKAYIEKESESDF